MKSAIEIRESLPGDIAPIEKLYPDAFPQEDLLPLVSELLAQGKIVLSLVAMDGSALAAHVIFTASGIAGSTGKAALLGPLAVGPAWQRKGVGSALVREGLQQLENSGTHQVFVLGDPAYYSRFGFEPDDRVKPPYRLPEERNTAWQSLCLSTGKPSLQGKLTVPQPWRRRELWAP